jgi:hypothetical protein
MAMIRFLAVIANGRGRVINVAASEVYRVAALEVAKGSVIVGDFSDPDVARRAVMLAKQG